jgi:hypothetical protein
MPRILSLHGITDLLETDNSIEASAIVIQPPENAAAHVSDEDSEDEEGGTINNLPGSLLRAFNSDEISLFFSLLCIQLLISS